MALSKVLSSRWTLTYEYTMCNCCSYISERSHEIIYNAISKWNFMLTLAVDGIEIENYLKFTVQFMWPICLVSKANENHSMVMVTDRLIQNQFTERFVPVHSYIQYWMHGWPEKPHQPY